MARNTIVLIGREEQRLEVGSSIVATRARCGLVSPNEGKPLSNRCMIELTTSPGILVVACQTRCGKAASSMCPVKRLLMARNTIVLIRGEKDGFEVGVRIVTARTRCYLVSAN